MELFRLLGTIAINNNEAIDGINETTDTAQKAESKMSAAFKKIGAVVATAFATERIIAFGRAIVDSYADYEQLVGGVDTLFKDSSKKVQEYANNAYKTAGLSANAYMETVTSFSASLLQSLGGNTAKAAEMADLAITDMSDNANKMGTDMTMIQNAYQGFAKQNYTMLDNLKLGYGGTKEEMERLLEDAEKISGFKYDISSYADIVEAIHVVQTEMGITGTTAKEASSTITGSISAMKGAWQNLLTGIAAGDHDLTQLLGNLMDSLQTVGQNLLPRVQTIFKSLGTLIMDNLAKGVDSNFAVFREKATEAVQKFGAKVKENFPVVVGKGLDLAIKLAEGVFKGLPKLIEKAPEMVDKFIKELGKSDGKLLKKGIEFVKILIDGIVKTGASLVKAAFEIGGNLIKGLWNGISDKADWVLDKIKGFGQNILDGIKDFFGIHSPSKVMEDEVGVQLALGVAEGIDKGKDKAKKSAEEMGQEILEAADQTLKEYKRVHDMSIAQEASYWAAIVQQTKKGTDARLEAEDRYYSALESYKQQYNDYVNSIMNQTSLFEAFGKDEDPVAGYTLIRNLESQVGGLTMYYDTLDSLHSKIGGTKLMEALEQMGVDSLNELNAINNMTDAQLQEYVNLYELKYALATQKATEALGTIEKETKKSTDNSNKTAKTALTKMTENFKTYTENMASTTKSKFDKIYSSISSNMAAAVAEVRSAVAQMNAALADAPTGSDVSVTAGGNVAPHAAGGILTKPTIFGYTPSTNTWHLGGEAGAEAIAPIDVLQGYVRSAVADGMKANNNGQVVNLLEQMVELLARNSNVKLEISGREFGRMVKEYA